MSLSQHLYRLRLAIALSDGLIVRCQVSEREVYYSLAPSKINENPELFDSISDLLTTSIPT